MIPNFLYKILNKKILSISFMFFVWNIKILGGLCCREDYRLNKLRTVMKECDTEEDFFSQINLLDEFILGPKQEIFEKCVSSLNESINKEVVNEIDDLLEKSKNYEDFYTNIAKLCKKKGIVFEKKFLNLYGNYLITQNIQNVLSSHIKNGNKRKKQILGNDVIDKMLIKLDLKRLILYELKENGNMLIKEALEDSRVQEKLKKISIEQSILSKLEKNGDMPIKKGIKK